MEFVIVNNTYSEYVLPLGKPSNGGGFTGLAWPEFGRTMNQISDSLVIWSVRSKLIVANWLGEIAASDLEDFLHPDSDCVLRGYKVKCNKIDVNVFLNIPISEDTGVGFFSWQRDEVVITSIAVDDFENFAIINVNLKDAILLASRCFDPQWDQMKYSIWKSEIDELSLTKNWIPLSKVRLGQGDEFN